MTLSLLMAICIPLQSGETECHLHTKYTVVASNDVAVCSDATDAAAYDSLIAGGKPGWSNGFCFDQKDYAAVVNASVAELESQGLIIRLTENMGSAK